MVAGLSRRFGIRFHACSDQAIGKCNTSPAQYLFLLRRLWRHALMR